MKTAPDCVCNRGSQRRIWACEAAYFAATTLSRVTSLARVDVVGPLRGEPLELVYLGVRVAFGFVVVLNPVDQELLDALLGKVRILLIDMPHGLVEIQRPDLRPEEFALSGIEAHIRQQTLPQFAQHIQPG